MRCASLLAVVLLLSACQRNFVDSLHHAAVRSCGKAKTCQIDLRQVADFDWDYVVDCGYTQSESQISAAVGFAVPAPEEFTRRDIFVKAGKVVRYDQRSQNIERADYGEVIFADGTNVAKCLKIDRADSRLTLKRMDAGEGEIYYLAMVPSEVWPKAKSNTSNQDH